MPQVQTNLMSDVTSKGAFDTVCSATVSAENCVSAYATVCGQCSVPSLILGTNIQFMGNCDQCRQQGPAVVATCGHSLGCLVCFRRNSTLLHVTAEEYDQCLAFFMDRYWT